MTVIAVEFEIFSVSQQVGWFHKNLHLDSFMLYFDTVYD